MRLYAAHRTTLGKDQEIEAPERIGREAPLPPSSSPTSFSFPVFVHRAERDGRTDGHRMDGRLGGKWRSSC